MKTVFNYNECGLLRKPTLGIFGCWETGIYVYLRIYRVRMWVNMFDKGSNVGVSFF